MYNGLSQVYLSNQKEESISIERVKEHFCNSIVTTLAFTQEKLQ